MRTKKQRDHQAKVLYTCGIDWQHEVGHTSTMLYESLAALKANRPCHVNCGIVRIVLTPKWLKKQTEDWTGVKDK